MSRPIRPGTIGSEATLAERIAVLRKDKKMTYEALATAMTEAGRPMTRDAIHRIENGKPRRKVSVDELVALTKVFGLSFEDLLMPMELVNQKRAADLLRRSAVVNSQLNELAVESFALSVEVATLALDQPELADYIYKHAAHAAGVAPGLPAGTDIAVVKAIVRFTEAISTAAEQRARGELDPDDLRSLLTEEQYAAFGPLPTTEDS